MSVTEPDQELPLLTEPSTKPLKVNTPETWDQALEAISNGHGPIAIDVERAQSYRYSNKAYLVQVKRSGAGIFIYDPVAFEKPSQAVADFSELAEAIVDETWIIHAATQDLPNLGQLGMHTEHLFDTELAGRLLGLPRVGLGPMVERYFGVHLLKQHGADDWSTRPIPDDWIAYAALDVELLIELRDKLIADLEAAGKAEWARQEFAYLVEQAKLPPAPRTDPWRRTSGSHQVKTQLGMAIVRQFWYARDEIAREIDKAPGRVVADKAISEFASQVKNKVPPISALRRVEGFRHREARKHYSVWQRCLREVSEMSSEDLPPMRVKTAGPPAPKNWAKHDPEAAGRWQRIRPQIVALAEQLNLPVENLISPDTLRKTLWKPAGETKEAIDEQLASLGARQWQRELIGDIIVTGLRA